MKDVLTLMRVVTESGISVDTVVSEAGLIIQEGHIEALKTLLDVNAIGAKEAERIEGAAAATMLLRALLNAFKAEWEMK